MKPTLAVRKLHPDARLPEKSRDSDLAWDLFFYKKEVGFNFIVLEANEFGIRLNTGIAIKLPDGYGAIIRDRSSMAVAGLVVSGGVIDNGYIGEIVVIMNNLNDESIRLDHGNKIAQLILIPIVDVELVEMSSLPVTDRGTQGFGSSGK